ncbi:MAG: GIY-YIG nuclease family protein [Alphaproteobacteria bacterium]|nr:GIY-YIG nuclease family protein [Alphaproteobacteria bacterium]
MLDKPKQPCVYIMASGVNGTLYIGVTSQLYDRVMIHKEDLVDGFTAKHQVVHHLVYYEMHPTMEAANVREKQPKKWNRLWKFGLVEEMNPKWQDLFVVGEGIVDAGEGGQSNRGGS